MNTQHSALLCNVSFCCSEVLRLTLSATLLATIHVTTACCVAACRQPERELERTVRRRCVARPPISQQQPAASSSSAAPPLDSPAAAAPARMRKTQGFAVSSLRQRFRHAGVEAAFQRWQAENVFYKVNP